MYDIFKFSLCVVNGSIVYQHLLDTNSWDVYYIKWKFDFCTRSFMHDIVNYDGFCAITLLWRRIVGDLEYNVSLIHDILFVSLNYGVVTRIRYVIICYT